MIVREVEVRYGKTIGKLDARSVQSPTDVAKLFREWIGAASKEHFVALHLNARHHIIGSAHVVSIGTVSSSLVHPRETFREAIVRNASAIIIAHNHPSGDPNPSKEDSEVTRRIARAGVIIGIKLLDHIIVGSPGHYSYSERQSHLLNNTERK